MPFTRKHHCTRHAHDSLFVSNSHLTFKLFNAVLKIFTIKVFNLWISSYICSTQKLRKHKESVPSAYGQFFFFYNQLQHSWNNWGNIEIPIKHKAWPKNGSSKKFPTNSSIFACLFTLCGCFGVRFLLQYHYNDKTVSYRGIRSEAGPTNGMNSKMIHD